MGFLYSIYGLRMSSFVQEHQVFLKAVEKEIEGAKACSVPTLLLPEITQPALPNPTGPGRPNPKLLANDPRKGKSQWAYEEKKFLVHHLWIEAVHNLQQKIYSKKNTRTLIRGPASSFFSHLGNPTRRYVIPMAH